MSSSLLRTSSRDRAASAIRQYTPTEVLLVWLAATAPMAFAAWVWAPWFVGKDAGPTQWARALMAGLTTGLVWQAVLVLMLVYREQSSLRWPVLREALWLNRPRSPMNEHGAVRIGLACLGLSVLMGLAGILPGPDAPANRDLATFLGSEAGSTFFRGNWLWLGVMLILVVFNTVLGEELLFRGLLLPRMQGVFGRWDWLMNGLLFAVYHLHQPWQIPAATLDALLLAWPSKYYRSAWIGIVVHSSQSVILFALILMLVV